MVFVIVKILSLKEWFACQYTDGDTNNLLDLYNDFSSGKIDKGDKYPVCDMCLSGKKTFVQKRGRMAGKEKTKRNN